MPDDAIADRDRLVLELSYWQQVLKDLMQLNELPGVVAGELVACSSPLLELALAGGRGGALALEVSERIAAAMRAMSEAAPIPLRTLELIDGRRRRLVADWNADHPETPLPEVDE